MKYYAVTEDPNELLHYGVKGMKWGQHIFGKERSPGYHRALGKLKASVKALSSTQKRLFSKKQPTTYKQASKKEQSRASEISRLANYDNDRAYYKQLNRDMRREQKVAKAMAKASQAEKRAQVAIIRQQAKDMQKAAKNEEHFDKIMKQARQGTLKYGKLSPEQVQRIQTRLQMEENTRRLGAKERTWRQQKKEARRAGKLQGITAGTAAAMTEVAKAGTQYGLNHLLNRATMSIKAHQEGKNERIKSAQKNRMTRRDINRKIREEAYESRVRNSEEKPLMRALHLKSAMDADYLLDKKKQEEKKNEQKKLRESDEQFRNRLYEKAATTAVLGVGGNDIGTITARLNKLDDLHKLIYEDSPSRYDQPVVKKQPLGAQAIIYKGLHKAKTKVAPVVKSRYASNNQHIYEPMVTRLTRSENIPDDVYKLLGISVEEEKRRYRSNNPLKG